MKRSMLAAVVLMLAVNAAAAPKKPTYKELEEETAALRARVAALEEQVKQKSEELAALRAKLPPHTPDDKAAQAEIDAAIKEKRLTPGMTLAQAEKAMGKKGELVEERAGGRQQYEWHIAGRTANEGGQPVFYKPQTLIAEFEGGVIVSHRKFFD